eukprot:29749-Pelagococcus_subviridis.AAC.6
MDPSCAALAASFRSLHRSATTCSTFALGTPRATAAASASTTGPADDRTPSPSSERFALLPLNPASNAAATILCTTTSGYRRIGDVKCVYRSNANA